MQLFWGQLPDSSLSQAAETVLGSHEASLELLRKAWERTGTKLTKGNIKV